MPLSSRTRSRRPAIEPIRTSYIDLPDRSCMSPRRRRSPLSRAVRSGAPASPPSDSEDEGALPMDKTALGKLRIPDSASPDATGLTTPSGTRWTIARRPHPTPLSAVSTSFHLAPPVIEVQATQRPNQATESNEMLTATTADGSCPSLSERLSSDRRQSAPSCGAAIRQLHFQRFREELWKQGSRTFGHAEGADVFVMPMQLRRPDRETGASSDDGAMSSSLSPPSGRLIVRAVVHSKKRVPIGLKREFDLNELRATIPDPLPSPHSPNFNREALLSALGTHGDARSSSPSPTAVDRGRNSSTEGQKGEACNRSPSLEGRYRQGAVAVPMHIQYARAQLPALAAIMMSDQVRPGDTIGLAVPHPKAWPETAAYVYTGEEELLTEQVKQNILYLGGKI